MTGTEKDFLTRWTALETIWVIENTWSSDCKIAQTNNLVSVLQFWLPDIGQETIDIEKQFSAILASSRMQKDYKLASNLVDMVNKNSSNDNYAFMNIIALLNQSQLFNFKSSIKKEYSFDKDDRDIKLRNSIKSNLISNSLILQEIPVKDIFKKEYQDLLSDFAISTGNLHIVSDCFGSIQELFWEANLSDDIRLKLETFFMESIILYYDYKISDAFVEKISDYYDHHFVPGIEEDPDYLFSNAISSFTSDYIVNPVFILDDLNKIARSQIWKYHMIRSNLKDILHDLLNNTKEDEDDLKDIFVDQEVQKKVKLIFESILREDNISVEYIKTEIYKWLQKTIQESKSEEEQD